MEATDLTMPKIYWFILTSADSKSLLYDLGGNLIACRKEGLSIIGEFTFNLNPIYLIKEYLTLPLQNYYVYLDKN